MPPGDFIISHFVCAADHLPTPRISTSQADADGPREPPIISRSRRRRATMIDAHECFRRQLALSRQADCRYLSIVYESPPMLSFVYRFSSARLSISPLGLPRHEVRFGRSIEGRATPPHAEMREATAGDGRRFAFVDADN